MVTMSGRFTIFGLVAVVLLLAGAAALGAVLDDSPDERRGEGTSSDVGLPPFLENELDLPPGLQRNGLPPGLAKKLEGPDTELSRLEKQGKVPPGHARRLGGGADPGD